MANFWVEIRVESTFGRGQVDPNISVFPNSMLLVWWEWWWICWVEVNRAKQQVAESMNVAIADQNLPTTPFYPIYEDIRFFMEKFET